MTTNSQPSGITIITGASGGMGSATARLMADAGRRHLLLCDLDQQRLEAVAAPLRERGITVDILADDLADPGFPQRLVTRLGGRQIDVLAHTAGIMASPAMNVSAERILQVNLDATARLLDAVREQMAPGSTAVLIASNSAYFPMGAEADAAFSKPLPVEGTAALLHLVPNPIAAYALSKRGVITLVKRQAKAFGLRGARLVSVSPGATDTPMAREGMKDSDSARRLIEQAAVARLAQPEEIASVIVFLCSLAASFIAGCDILVDGGEIAGTGL